MWKTFDCKTDVAGEACRNRIGVWYGKQCKSKMMRTKEYETEELIIM